MKQACNRNKPVGRTALPMKMEKVKTVRRMPSSGTLRRVDLVKRFGGIYRLHHQGNKNR
jgi:hypothetical protein